MLSIILLEANLPCSPYVIVTRMYANGKLRFECYCNRRHFLTVPLPEHPRPTIFMHFLCVYYATFNWKKMCIFDPFERILYTTRCTHIFRRKNCSLIHTAMQGLNPQWWTNMNRHGCQKIRSYRKILGHLMGSCILPKVPLTGLI